MSITIRKKSKTIPSHIENPHKSMTSEESVTQKLRTSYKWKAKTKSVIKNEKKSPLRKESFLRGASP